MGGGLLQKVNRDTQRFAFKSSAQKREGVWHDISKQPLDQTKASKRGRLKLIDIQGQLSTVNIDYRWDSPDQLVTVFENGLLTNTTDFATVRERAALQAPVSLTR